MTHFFTAVRCLGLCTGLLLFGLVRCEAQTQAPNPADTSYVQFVTTLGNINVQLLSSESPLNVTNFMSYVKSGAYNSSFIHRSIPRFIIQGGGFNISNGTPSVITAGSPVLGEHDPKKNPNAFSNVHGTLAMALQEVAVSAGGDSEDTGTTNWFFNLVDNTFLDSAQQVTDPNTGINYISGPFTVFGVVADASSMAVMDQIADLQTYDASSYFASLYGVNFPSGAFTNLPLINFVSTPLSTSNFAVLSVLPYTPFSAWQTAFSSDPNAATDSLPGAIPQNDSTSNLLKYVCDVPANQTMTNTSRAKLPVSGMVKIGSVPYLTLTYHQRQNLSATGVTASVVTSTDLVNWAAPTNPITTQTPANDGSGDMIIEVEVPAPASGSQFLQLNLSQ